MVSGDPSHINETLAFRATLQLLGEQHQSKVSKNEFPPCRAIFVSESLSPSLYKAFRAQGYEHLTGDQGRILVITKPSLIPANRKVGDTSLVDVRSDAPRCSTPVRKLIGPPEFETDIRASRRNQTKPADQVRVDPKRVLTVKEEKSLVSRLSINSSNLNVADNNFVLLPDRRTRRSFHEQSAHVIKLSKPRRQNQVLERIESPGKANKTQQPSAHQSEIIARLSKPRSLEQIFSRYLRGSSSGEPTDHSRAAVPRIHADIVIPPVQADLNVYMESLCPNVQRSPQPTWEPTPLAEAVDELCGSIFLRCVENEHNSEIAEDYIRMNILPSLSRRATRQVDSSYASESCQGLCDLLNLLNMFYPSELCAVRLYNLLVMLST